MDLEQVERWSRHYDYTAKKEGWLLTNDDHGIIRIARLDDPEQYAGYEDWPPNFTEPCFRDDDDAIDFVERVADAGSYLHEQAIAIHRANLQEEPHVPRPSMCELTRDWWNNLSPANRKTVLIMNRMRNDLMNSAWDSDVSKYYASELVDYYAQHVAGREKKVPDNHVPEATPTTRTEACRDWWNLLDHPERRDVMNRVGLGEGMQVSPWNAFSLQVQDSILAYYDARVLKPTTVMTKRVMTEEAVIEEDREELLRQMGVIVSQLRTWGHEIRKGLNGSLSQQMKDLNHIYLSMFDVAADIEDKYCEDKDNVVADNVDLGTINRRQLQEQRDWLAEEVGNRYQDDDAAQGAVGILDRLLIALRDK